MDVRAYLHRDGSVIMPVSLEELQNPQALYQEVGETLFAICVIHGWDLGSLMYTGHA